jgi:hypothetical protein
VTITFRSGRRGNSRFRTPISKSTFSVRSCASSTPELRVDAKIRQQQTIGHQRETRGIGDLIGESHAKTDAAAHRLSDFLGDAGGQGARRQPSRLRMRNQGVRAASQLQAILGQLSALAGAGVAGHDEHLAPAQCLHDGFALRRDRQIRVMLENELEGAARSGRRSPVIRHA